MSDPDNRRRLRRELARMRRLDRDIATRSERSIFVWLAQLARKMRSTKPRVRVRLRRDAIGWLWRQVSGRS